MQLFLTFVLSPVSFTDSTPYQHRSCSKTSRSAQISRLRRPRCSIAPGVLIGRNQWQAKQGHKTDGDNEVNFNVPSNTVNRERLKNARESLKRTKGTSGRQLMSDMKPLPKFVREPFRSKKSVTKVEADYHKNDWRKRADERRESVIDRLDEGTGKGTFKEVDKTDVGASKNKLKGQQTEGRSERPEFNPITEFGPDVAKQLLSQMGHISAKDVKQSTSRRKQDQDQPVHKNNDT